MPSPDESPIETLREREEASTINRHARWWIVLEVVAFVGLCYLYASAPAPAVNEAHYLIKAKNFWDSSFCSNDFFVTSGKAHTTFYWLFGWPTLFFSLSTTAWLGRVVAWAMLGFGLQQCCQRLRLPVFSSTIVAILWIAGIQAGNFAGEWVIGGIEGKVPAYGLALVGLSRVMERQWKQAWIWFGMSSAFHVLTGGWCVVAATICYVITERGSTWLQRLRLPLAGEPQSSPERFFSWQLFAGGAIALFGLVPAILLMRGVSPEDATMAAHIYGSFRLPHHLLPTRFPTLWYLRFSALIVLLLCFFPRRDRGTDSGAASHSADNANNAAVRLFYFAIATLLIAGCGLVIGYSYKWSPDFAVKLSRYYWFRLSDAIVPLTAALLIIRWLSENRTNESRTLWLDLMAKGSIALGVVIFVVGTVQSARIGIPKSCRHRYLGIVNEDGAGIQRKRFADWLTLCDWVRIATPEDEVFITPRQQQTFKWYAQRAEVVNWKDVPQDAQSLLQWKQRYDHLFQRQLGDLTYYNVRVPIDYRKLNDFRDTYGVRFMVVDNRVVSPFTEVDQLPLIKVYPVGEQQNDTFSVYELPYHGER